MSEIIRDHNSVDEYKNDMVLYSIAVILKRAIPEIRDGLKPIQRRIIWDLYHDMKGNGFVKSKRVSGDVIGKYSPHGDDSAYQAFLPILNWYQTKLPLLEGQGIFGTLAGDRAAASRYTEVRLSKFALEAVVKDFEDDLRVVDFVSNFDQSLKEPSYLPVCVPLLLMQGNSGIAVGISSDIPVHNVIETLEVTRHLLKNPDYKFILVPDQCQPTYIIDTDWNKINEYGGKFTVRGIVKKGVYRGARDKEDYPALYILSTPDGVYSDQIRVQLEELAEKKQVPMIRDIYDNTKGNHVEIIIQLNKGSDIEYVKRLLYKKTSIEVSKRVNFEIIDGIDSKNISYRDYLLRWIEYRKITKYRQYNLRLRNISTKKHTLDTYVQAMESGYIDEIIALIRRQKKVEDKNVLTEFIISKCNMTKLQAEYLLSVDLRRLATGYLPIYKHEINELEKKYKECEAKIINKDLIVQEIDDELLYIEKKYGTPRLATIIKDKDDIDIPKGTFKLVITMNNYIRKLSLEDKVYTIRGDKAKYIMIVDNTEHVLLFDHRGRVFRLPVWKIFPTDKNSIGINIQMILKNCTGNIISAIYEPLYKQAVNMTNPRQYLVSITNNNFIKRIDLNDISNIPINGIIYTKVNIDDMVRGVLIAGINMDILIYTTNKVLRLHIKDIPEFKRASIGSRAINTTNNIMGMSIIYPDSKYIISITENGKLNKVSIDAILSNKRGISVGNNITRISKGDKLVSILVANNNDSIYIVSSNNIYNILVSDIPIGTTVSSGI